jgi:hypothetical protein
VALPEINHGTHPAAGRRERGPNPAQCNTPALRQPYFAASREVQLHFVYVTPAPGLAWLDRFHDGVFRVMEMLGGVFIFGRIAAADVAALET